MPPRRPQDHLYALAALLLTFSGSMLFVATVATAVAPRTAGVQAHALEPRPSPSTDLAGRIRGAAALRPRPAAALPKPAPPAPPPAPPPPPPVVLTALPNPAVGGLSSMSGGVLVDLDRKQVVWQYIASSPFPTASLGKIYTVMVAMDHAQSLEQVVTVPPGGEDDNPDDSVMGLHVGDQVTVRQLIEGIWLASGDDAAETLARVFIPRDQFIAEMNAKAAMLGLRATTHLANPSGLDDQGQYSSALDLAVASTWLEINYPSAFALAGESFVPLPPNGLHHEDLTLRTINKMVDNYRDSGHGYPGITGLKTGYTEKAGGCVIITATRGGRHLAVVLLNDNWFFADASTLLDYGFSH